MCRVILKKVVKELHLSQSNPAVRHNCAKNIQIRTSKPNCSGNVESSHAFFWLSILHLSVHKFVKLLFKFLFRF